MKITEVSYKKLFNLGEYEHEEFRFTAEVEPNETGDQVLSKLIHHVENAHKAIAMLNGISTRIDRIYATWNDPYCTSMTADAIEHHEKEINHEKEQIKRLVKQRKEEHTKEKKKTFTEQINQKEEDIVEHEKKIKELKKEGKELTKKLEKYRQMFRDGNLSFLIKE
jgi:DNA repair exonuclease SbcCD ATPase subunit